ncbi:MAG: hypothetical protein ACOH5I_21860 [Oligoflexus sp.]
MTTRIIDFATGYETDESESSQVGADTIAFTPYLTVESTNVQDAIEELKDELDAFELQDLTDAVGDLDAEVDLKAPKASPAFTGQQKNADGSVSAPAISFTADTNTGFFRPGDDTLGVATGGVEAFRVDSSGATFQGDIRLGNRISIDGALSPNVGLYNRYTLTGATTQYGYLGNHTIQDDVTSIGYGARIIMHTDDGGAGLTNLYYYQASQGTYTGTVTNSYGFYAASNLTTATNNYGFYSDIGTAGATNKWNFYAAGTAPNYFAGNVGIGTDSPSEKFDVDGNARVRSNLVLDGTMDLNNGTGSTGQVPAKRSDGSMEWATVATVEETIDAAAGTSGVTLGTTDESVHVFTPSTAITVKLDNTYGAGRSVTIINNGTADITLDANDDSEIGLCEAGVSVKVISLASNPADSDDWKFTVPGLATADNAGFVPSYVESGEGDLGTITNWTSPGPGSAKYKWTKIGNKVDFWWYVSSDGGSVSTSTSVFFFTFPADAPVPSDFSNIPDTTSAMSIAGSSMITESNSTASNARTQHMTALAYNGSIRRIYVRCETSAKTVWSGHVSYFTA